MLPNLLLQVGPFSIYSFGAFLALAYVIGVFLFWRAGRGIGFSSDDLFDLVLLVSFTALVGGRGSFLILTGGVGDLLALLRVGEGFSLGGALIFGLAVTYLFSRFKGWSYLRIVDLAVVPLSLAQALGFLGAGLVGLSPLALQLSLGYFLLSIILWFVGNRTPLGTTLFIYLVFSGVFFYFVETNLVLSSVLVVGSILGWVATRYKRFK